MAKNIRTKPTTSTIHEGTPIVVILYYLTFSHKIPIFLCVNAKKNKWHLTIWSTATSFPRFSPTRPWLGELLLKKVYLTMWWIHIFKWGPRVFNAEVKRGGGGGLGLQFGLKIRWGWGQGLPPHLRARPLDPPMTLQVHGLRSTNSLHVSVETIVSSLKRTGFKAWWPPQD